MLVTNIEADHLDHYRDLDEIYEKFAAFIGSVPADGGVVVACGDDEELAALARAAGHLMRGLARDGGADIQRLLLHAEQRVLDFIRIADDAALVDLRRAGHVGQQLADQPAGARLRRRQRQSLLPQVRKRLLSAAVHLHSTGSASFRCWRWRGR